MYLLLSYIIANNYGNKEICHLPFKSTFFFRRIKLISFLNGGDWKCWCTITRSSSIFCIGAAHIFASQSGSLVVSSSPSAIVFLKTVDDDRLGN